MAIDNSSRLAMVFSFCSPVKRVGARRYADGTEDELPSSRRAGLSMTMGALRFFTALRVAQDDGYLIKSYINAGSSASRRAGSRRRTIRSLRLPGRFLLAKAFRKGVF